MTTLPGLCTARSIAKQYGLDVAEKWYEHKPESVIETATIKLLWDFTIQTHREIQARRPDIVLVNRKENDCIVIDIGVPEDASIADKEKGKIQRYQDIRRDITRLWNIKTYVVPVVVGSLGIAIENLVKHLGKITTPTMIELLQKASLLGSAKLLRNVLED